MIRLLTAGVLSCCTLSVCVLAQSGNAKPTFEVASVRQISRDEVVAKFGPGAYSGLTISGSRVNMGGWQMSTLISTAFRLNPRLIVGVPLVGNSLFSIEAIMPEGATRDQLPEMLRALLEDRFHLKTHLEGMDQSGYALVPGKGTQIESASRGRPIDLQPLGRRSECSRRQDLPCAKLRQDSFRLHRFGVGTDRERGLQRNCARGVFQDFQSNFRSKFGLHSSG